MRTFALLIALCLLPMCRAQILTDPNFTVDFLATPGFGTIGLEFGPEGRLYFGEKQGRVWVMQRNASGGYGTPTLFHDLISNVYSSGESGLLGLALDPDFATNRHMYLFYTTPADQRLVRVTADATYNVISGGETILLSGLPRAATNHKAGDINFRPGEPDAIYLALGDDANTTLTNNLDVYHGKMLRLNKLNGEGLTTNPFYTAAGGTTSVRSRIWAHGFRNPFRIAFHPANPVPNAFYASENGGPGGVTLQDRIIWLQQGCYGGWDNIAASAGETSTFYNPPNPPGAECVVMNRQTSSLIGIGIAQGGVFGDPAFPGSATLFCSNWLSNGGCIWRWRLSGANHNVLNPIPVDSGQPFVRNLFATDLKIGPEGAVYFTQAVNGTSAGTNYRVGRIRRIGPSVNFATNPDPAAGPAPLNVSFTDLSSGPNPVTAWHWDFGNGQTSSQQHPTMSFTQPGVYNVILTVTDSAAGQGQFNRPITVWHPPVAAFTMSPTPASGPPPLNVQFTDASTDADGTIAARHWNFGNGQTSTQTNPSHVYNAPGTYTVTLTVTDNHALTDQLQRTVTVLAPPVADFNFTPSGGPAPLVVQFMDASSDADGVVVARHWDFGNGQTSNAMNPSTIFTTAGTFNVTLTVTDNHNLQRQVQKPVNVSSGLALTLVGDVLDAVSGSGLATSTQLRLYQADGTTPLAFSGGVGPAGNAIAVPPGGAFSTTIGLPAATSAVVVSAGEPTPDGVEPQFIGIGIGRASTHTANLTFHLSALTLRGRVLTTLGDPAWTDVGVSRGAPGVHYNFAGGRDYLAASGILLTGVNHRVSTDALGYWHVPIAPGDGSTSFYLDVVGDTGAALYLPQQVLEALPAAGTVIRNITLGLTANPGGADSLSGIPVTPGVDLASRIQPIFDAHCVSCHSGTEGPNLSPGLSYAALVNVPSAQVPGLRLVQPGNAGLSWLFLKVNSHTPQFGDRMAPGSPLSLNDQALIRDWINQGAAPAASSPASDGGKDDDGSGCSLSGGTLLWPLAALVFWRRRRAPNPRARIPRRAAAVR